MGQDPTVIRPHATSSSKMNEDIFKQHGLKTLLWTIDAKDWEMTEAKAIVSAIMAKVKPGDVILFRDSRPHVVQAVSMLIDALYADGYELLTASEMLSFPDDTPKRR
jgi:peptidoglycan-N-acetylglucosamine deacetylase